MDQPDWYPTWRHQAVHELMEKNTQLDSKLNLFKRERYDYDLETGLLKFSHEGKVTVVANIQVVGSTAETARNWLWAWGNSHLPELVTVAAESTKRFGEEHRISELTSAYLEDESLVNLGWELAAVTARVTGAIGAYRPPSKNGHLFLVLRDAELIT